MTRDDIVKMAQEAAIMPPNWGATENQWRSLHAFAELVRADEREACALAALNAPIKTHRQDMREACVNAIRARGQA